MTYSKPQPLKIPTKKGEAQAQVSSDGAVLQVNVMYSSMDQPPIFIVLHNNKAQRKRIPQLVATLIEGEPLPSDSNITSRVPGCITAGTGARIQKVEFGVPHVEHAST